MEGVKEGRTLRFSIDRGGTFTDVFAEVGAHAGAATNCTLHVPVLGLTQQIPIDHTNELICFRMPTVTCC
jgi:hypothetical protein